MRRLCEPMPLARARSYESTVSYSYDAMDRLTQVLDSITGTVTRNYDGLDRLTSEMTPQGTVSYGYDTAGRRSTMTVAGQPAVAYTYDNANRPLQITQGSANVTFSYVREAGGCRSRCQTALQPTTPTTPLRS